MGRPVGPGVRLEELPGIAVEIPGSSHAYPLNVGLDGLDPGARPAEATLFSSGRERPVQGAPGPARPPHAARPAQSPLASVASAAANNALAIALALLIAGLVVVLLVVAGRRRA